MKRESILLRVETVARDGVELSEEVQDNAKILLHKIGQLSYDEVATMVNTECVYQRIRDMAMAYGIPQRFLHIRFWVFDWEGLGFDGKVSWDNSKFKGIGEFFKFDKVTDA